MSSSPVRTRLRRGLAAWPLAILVVVLAVAPPSATPPIEQVRLESGMRIAIDPETGDLLGMPATPDLEMEVFLQRSLSRSSAGLVEVHHPDGSVSMDLQGRFMNASVARIGDDGGLRTLCTDDFDDARSFLAGRSLESAHAHGAVR